MLFKEKRTGTQHPTIFIKMDPGGVENSEEKKNGYIIFTNIEENILEVIRTRNSVFKYQFKFRLLSLLLSQSG